MPANLRLTLSDEEAERLDALRGAATRTAYATLLIQRSLLNGSVTGNGLAESPDETLQRILREELAPMADADTIRRIVHDAIRDAAMGG